MPTPPTPRPRDAMRTLGIEPRITGHTRVTFDAAVDTRPVVVCLSEAAHELLALEPGKVMTDLVWNSPRRFSTLGRSS